MKAFLCVAMALLAGCGGQVTIEPDGASDWAADETAIRAALQASEDAWNSGDLKGHLASYDPSVTFMTREGPRPGVEPIEKAFNEHYFRDGKPKQALRLDRIVLRPLDDDAALATGRYTLSGGDEPEQTGHFTTVWVRKADGWRAVHDHSN